MSAVILSYGGGDNSAALVVGLHARGQRPDAIVFADTGGERGRTYGHMWQWMQPWLDRVGFPPITIVRGEAPQQRVDGSLEAQCLRLRAIPSRAFGFGQCSAEWKIRPMERWCAARYGPGYTKLIAFHADEAERVLRTVARDYVVRYPLIEWGWGPEDCLDALRRAGLPPPGKSACFFCPSTRPAAVRTLRREEPDLLARALAMEARWLAHDGGGAVKGLGRHFSWARLLDQGELFGDDLRTPEACSDGCFT